MQGVKVLWRWIQPFPQTRRRPSRRHDYNLGWHIMCAMVTAAIVLFWASSAAGQWTLQDGTRVSFVFVLPSEKRVWRPNGEAVSYDAIPKPVSPVWQSGNGVPILVALTKTTEVTKLSPSVRFKLPATGLLNAQFFVPCRDKRIWMSGYTPPEVQPSMQDVAVGVASGPWRLTGWVEFAKSGQKMHAVKQHGTPVKLKLNGSSPRHSAGPFTLVDVPAQPVLDNVAVRFVVRDKSGREYPFTGSNPLADDRTVTNYGFEGDVLDVSRVECQIRPFEWTTIKVAHFKPN